MIGKRFSGYITAAMICILAVMLIRAGREAAAGAAAAVNLCLTVMIPSLFAFTVISKLMIASDIYRIMGQPFSWISRYIFRLPGDFFPVFLISQLAGYPIGAALIGEMHRGGRISAEDAEKMLCFCIAPGPAYIMAVSAAAAPKSPGVWAAVFIAVICSNCLLVLLSAPFRRIPPKERASEISVRLTAESFTDAVRSGSESMLMICGMIVFMSAMLGMIGKTGLLAKAAAMLATIFGGTPAEIYPFVRSFFEISGLTGIMGDGTAVIPAAAAMLSFGGICVHMQIGAVIGKLSEMPALISRLPAAVMSFYICRALMPKFYTVSVIAASADIADERVHIIHNSPPILSIFLLIMTILIISQKSIVKNKKM